MKTYKIGKTFEEMSYEKMGQSQVSNGFAPLTNITLTYCPVTITTITYTLTNSNNK
ncbi:hypothetical protein KYB31_00825 [Clostridium felsineum]|uniref:hypothetical protein n=1 Tax=Clostridium felsineum TaxID=36839 RepID=UPI00214D24C0|nr:hypothetical protein [Clostridium felsineum]MCR3757533.1 hypothetical protein [Clostridium felsineum]